MMSSRILTLFVTSLVLVGPVWTQCPSSECECHSSGDLLCRAKQLSSVPTWQNTDDQFGLVTLAQNNIASLQANAFRTPNGDALSMRELDLTNNRITSINDNTFAGLEDQLEVLKLDVDGMTSFPAAIIYDEPTHFEGGQVRIEVHDVSLCALKLWYL